MLRKNRLSRSSKRCLTLALAVISCTSLPAFAAPPDAGTIAGQIAGQVADSVKEQKIVVPPKADIKIEVSEDQPTAPPVNEGDKFKISGLHITGQTIYSEATLQDLVKDATNQELTLPELQTIARRISQYFRDHGYMVANAFIPAQDITDGIAEITVVPGQYGNIDIRNHSRLADNTAARLLSSLKSGDYVKKDTLERTLLLISDTSGISIKATLVPGKTSGTSDLIVEINDTKATTAEFSLDNYGNRFTGQRRSNLNLNFNNISGKGDAVSISGTNSGGDLNNGTINYMLPVGSKGAKIGVGYSQLHYTIGKEFEALEAGGTSKNTSIFGIYPLVRSRNYNLYGVIEYNHRKIEDHIDTYDAFTDKHSNAWTIGLNGSNRDKFRGGGVNNFALTITTGRLSIDDGQDMYGIAAQTVDNKGLQTTGSYTKANVNFNRLQYLNNRLNLYLGFTGQLANKNLDSSEKLFIGGANAVRAYPQGEASGDQGYLLTGELRWNMPTPAFQLAAFIDNGRVSIDKNPVAGSGDNSRILTGAGLGLILNKQKDYTLRVDYAWKLSSSDATSDRDKSGRWWVKGTQRF
ncbi:ShlB/FhaC/HecB family hemolysin secretion/activation protein [Sporomusa sp. KB1]|jgi:hemolysin activation/secretion protein|uniref:ShlB/FhaC/HecB family hemolysin secretion/activation protein n=1 Tax=Sporomusa sp. KB1 TaxID=943346 RepID=UPI0011A68B2D|nr:ShlB/FhaC/HecB family hemolysin secretion/activation protein [Sporomusa sp. KB1]TWH51615.1 hemolysin activation/secretion protein [Sporomusa sp. KB1]TWH52194.1 hemolysin activation/secretion protein [Sporomusa sp. KB1]